MAKGGEAAAAVALGALGILGIFVGAAILSLDFARPRGLSAAA